MTAPALKNKLDSVLEAKGWDYKTFVGHCIINGLSPDTAYRLTRGDTKFTIETVAVFAEVLGVSSIAEIIDLADDQDDPA